MPGGEGGVAHGSAVEEEELGGLAEGGRELAGVEEGEAELGLVHALGELVDAAAHPAGVGVVLAGQVAVGQAVGEAALDELALVAGQGLGQADELLGVQPKRLSAGEPIVKHGSVWDSTRGRAKR